MYKVEFLRGGISSPSSHRARQPRYDNPDYIHVGIALLTSSSHRTGVYVPTTSLAMSMSKVRILLVVLSAFF